MESCHIPSYKRLTIKTDLKKCFEWNSSLIVLALTLRCWPFPGSKSQPTSPTVAPSPAAASRLARPASDSQVEREKGTTAKMLQPFCWEASSALTKLWPFCFLLQGLEFHSLVCNGISFKKKTHYLQSGWPRSYVLKNHSPEIWLPLCSNIIWTKILAYLNITPTETSNP